MQRRGVVGLSAWVLTGCGGGGGSAPPPAVQPGPAVPASVSLSVPEQQDLGRDFTPGVVAGSSTAGLSFQWDFGDGATSTVAAAVHRYATPGRYVVKLTLRDEAGRTAAASATLEVLPEAKEVGAPRFADAQFGWLFGSDGSSAHQVLLLTANGGRSWRRVLTPLSQWGDVIFRDVRQGWLVEPPGATARRCWRTQDGGQTWVRVADVPVMGAGLRVSRAGLLAALNPYGDPAQRGSAVSADGGATWRHTSFVPDRVGDTGVLYRAENDDGGVWQLTVSTDLGFTHRVALRAMGPAGSVGGVDLDGPGPWRVWSPGPLWAGDPPDGPMLYESSDEGRSWQRRPLALPAELDSASAQVQLRQGDILVSARRRAAPDEWVLVRSADGARSWQASAALPGAVAVGHWMIPACTVAAVPGQRHAFASTDGGRAWHACVLPADPAALQVWDDVGGGVVAMVAGVYTMPTFLQVYRRYVSADAGRTWQLLPAGLPI